MITHLYHVENLWNLERILNIIKSVRGHTAGPGGGGGGEITFPCLVNSEAENSLIFQ